MAHLDLDTADLLAVGRRARQTSEAVTAMDGGRIDEGEAHRAAGDPVLAQAMTALFGAWAPVHRDLADALSRLGTALTHAADTFDQAEGTTAERLASAIRTGHPAGSSLHEPTLHEPTPHGGGA